MFQDFMGVRFVEDEKMPTEYDEEVVFEGHWIVKWFATWLRFDPDVRVTYHRRNGPMYMLHGTLYGHPSVIHGARAAVGMGDMMV